MPPHPSQYLQDCTSQEALELAIAIENDVPSELDGKFFQLSFMLDILNTKRPSEPKRPKTPIKKRDISPLLNSPGGNSG